ncbi:hypothetical protein GWK47_000307 [Chionoecetes opilio]|uniref:Uncharacterized protein n=1 Tax=Chionoecetes opilio TaxID=41210 RepID=A0A8J4YS31_CHIOP|nr:hypothetical protein GWK47_000307 [Chionoecetes opilio]
MLAAYVDLKKAFDPSASCRISSARDGPDDRLATLETLEETTTAGRPAGPQSCVQRKSGFLEWRAVPVKFLLRLAFREGYLLKSDYEADSENITEVRLQKGRAAWSRKVFDLSAPRLPKHYSRSLAFKKNKVCDLQYLLDLMPVNKQTFYNYIIDAHTVGLTEDVPPDEDPDDLDELLEYQ